MLNKYPIDFSELEKGDILDVSILEQITGKKPGTREYKLKVLGLQGQIMRETGYTVKLHNDDELVILTDEEATKHNDEWFNRHKRGMFNRFELMKNVEVANLTEISAANHERKLLNQGKYIQALVGARKEKVLVIGSKRKELDRSVSTTSETEGGKLNFTTQIAAEKTIGEIYAILMKAKAQEISFENGNGSTTAVKFCIKFLENPLWFRLAPNVDGVYKAMERDNVQPRYRNKTQALNTAWRIMKDAIEAQMAIVQSNQGEIAEVFLPYAYDLESGRTVFAHFKDNRQKQLTAGNPGKDK